MVEIEFDQGNVDFASIVSDQNASFALVEIWRECVSNAVRHGLASKVSISLHQENGYITSVIANNGLQPDKSISRSLGSTILDDLSTEWWFDLPPNKSQLVEVHCKVILAGA